jgi:hypothetical protein
MGVLERDPLETARTLESWMAGRADVEVPRVDQVSIPSSTGWSNETVFFEAAWREDGVDRQERLVARIAPSGYRVFPDDTFPLQYTAMRTLAEHSDVPMPVIHWFESDVRWFGQPFWIMEYVEGDIAADTPHYAGEGWLKDAPAERWSSRTGRDVEALDYFVLLGGLRFTVIMVRMGKLLHEMGLVPAEFAYDNLISQAMEELLPS